MTTKLVMESRLKINAIHAMINFHSPGLSLPIHELHCGSPSELCRRGMLLAIVHV